MTHRPAFGVLMELLTGLWLGMPSGCGSPSSAPSSPSSSSISVSCIKEAHEIDVKESLWMSALYIGLGLLWAVAVWFIYYN
ncbi:hypothetical protein [Mycobacterium tuberculosis]|uniref:hypothetical protein n=1 Tax=Mycobacterium tuberculosis TaxID=1773 RepID=UPI002729FC97|nr:hypothetical protein [Mycobacterium tuberculosis]